MSGELRKPQKVTLFILTLIFFFIIFLLLLSRSMHRELDHDEQLYVSSGGLLASKLLLPYKDYHYSQMPNLAFFYAVIFALTDHLLLAARTFSVLCALLSMGLIFYISFNLFSGYHYLIRFLIAGGGVILLFMDEVFANTSGLAWNHDSSVLLALLAFFLYSYGARQERPKKWVFLSGIFLGLAIGIRLTLVFLTMPFLGAIFLYPNVTTQQERVHLLLLFSLGVFLSMLPSLLLCMLAPQRFVFGNIVGYHQLHTLRIIEDQGLLQRPITVGGKLNHLIAIISDRGNLSQFTLYALSLFLSIGTAISKHIKTSNYFEIIVIAILIPFLLIGSLTPSPSHEQYFYTLIPFLVLGTLYGVAFLQGEKIKWGLMLLALTIGIIVSSLNGHNKYRYIDELLSPDSWTTIKVHKIGIEVKNAVGKGKVLTLAPLFPLEGGLEIYEEFAVGPFAWRIASLLPENERVEQGIISEDELNDFLRTKPPDAILVGVEVEEAYLEKPFVRYAQENGYKPLELSTGETLWVFPH